MTESKPAGLLKYAAELAGSSDMNTPLPANSVRLDALAVAEATGGRALYAERGRVALGVTTDSRAVMQGSAFVALRGQRSDGHAYVAAAIEAGASLVIVERGRAPHDRGRSDVVEVDDTLVAWGALARAHLRDWRRGNPEARVVAITGSAGKTTTKELCAALLRTVGACHAAAGNLNNRIGVPAVALEIQPQHRFLVLEMGMSVPREIEALAAIAAPDVGVITNIGLAHAAGVGGTIDDVAREKGALLDAVRTGVAITNADDAAIGRQVLRAGCEHVTSFGFSERSDYRLVSRQPKGAYGSLVTVRRPGAETATFHVPIPGAAAAIDFVAALAAGEAAACEKLQDARVASALRSLQIIPGRMHVRRLKAHVLLFDDAYNASPATMRAALATLAEVAEGRRVAVLGAMSELGPTAQREHDALGGAVADAGVDLLVSCGGLADAIALEAERRGVAVILAPDAEAAARIAVDRVRPGDSVLVKASRSVGAERVVEALVRAQGEEAR